jgi:hypothetical protein
MTLRPLTSESGMAGPGRWRALGTELDARIARPRPKKRARPASEATRAAEHPARVVVPRSPRQEVSSGRGGRAERTAAPPSAGEGERSTATPAGPGLRTARRRRCGDHSRERGSAGAGCSWPVATGSAAPRCGGRAARSRGRAPARPDPEQGRPRVSRSGPGPWWPSVLASGCGAGAGWGGGGSRAHGSSRHTAASGRAAGGAAGAAWGRRPGPSGGGARGPRRR